jgi:hypothetical protein
MPIFSILQLVPSVTFFQVNFTDKIPTGIFCSFNHPKPVFARHKHTYMQLVRLSMVDWDMERLCFLEELCDDVITSRLHVSQVGRVGRRQLICQFKLMTCVAGSISD